MIAARIARILRLRTRSLAEREAVDRELQRELAFHLDHLVAENIAQGMDPAAALAAARRTLGNQASIEEECRDRRSVNWAHDFWQDLRYGARMLRASRAFTVTAVLSLAIGIGGNAALVGVLASVKRGALMIPDADGLMIVRTVPVNAPEARSNALMADFLEWKDRAKSFASMGASLAHQVEADADEYGTSERLFGQAFTPELFPILGVQPLMGRFFTEEEAQSEKRGAVMVISYGLWQRRFRGDPRILERTVRLSRRPTQIIGVMPQGFGYTLDSADYWVPLRTERNPAAVGARFFIVAARLKPGVTAAQAQAEMEAIASQLAQEQPDREQGWSVRLEPIREAMFGWAESSLYTMEAAVVLILVIACTNVAGLLLARGAARRSEIALRAALGAGRGRIVRQLLTESVLLSLLAGAAGFIFAALALQVTTKVAPQPGATHLPPVAVDLRMFAVALITSVMVGALLAFAPACAATRPPGRRADLRSGRLRAAFVAGQIAVALVLLTATGLLTKSFARQVLRDVNFNPGGLMSFEYRIPLAEYLKQDGDQVLIDPPPAWTIQRVYQRLQSIPGVISVAGMSNRPVNSLGVPRAVVRLEGDGPVAVPERRGATVVSMIVTPNLFRTLQARLVAGREIDQRDDSGRPWAAVVNETMARRFWPGENPIGKRLVLEGMGEENFREVVGMIRDIPVRMIDRVQEPVVYTSYLQQPVRLHGTGGSAAFGQMTFFLRTAGRPADVVEAARRAVNEADPGRPIANVGAVMAFITGRVPAFAGYLLAIAALSVIATLLAVMGIYGVTAYAVEQRTPELAIRIALGARPAQVAGLIGRWAMSLTVLGVAAGILGALGSARLIQSQLWGVLPTDPQVLAGSVLLLAAAAMVACFLPARRAMRVDPAAALRVE